MMIYYLIYRLLDQETGRIHEIKDRLYREGQRNLIPLLFSAMIGNHFNKARRKERG